MCNNKIIYIDIFIYLLLYYLLLYIIVQFIIKLLKLCYVYITFLYFKNLEYDH